MPSSPQKKQSVAHKVVLTATALDDLKSIFLYIADAAGIDIAEGYDRRIRGTCLSLADFPARGTPRDDLMPGLRSIAFERQATIAYRIEGRQVLILRILHHGRDPAQGFDPET